MSAQNQLTKTWDRDCDVLEGAQNHNVIVEGRGEKGGEKKQRHGADSWGKVLGRSTRRDQGNR
jgi:hypothetical protein